MKKVTVYSKPDCQQCNMTYRVLNLRGIDHTVIDISLDQDAFKYVTEELGYMQAPVVVYGEDHWSGFRPDKLNDIHTD